MKKYTLVVLAVFFCSYSRPGKEIVYEGRPLSKAPIKILINRGYIAGYSDIRRNPLWVAYRLSRCEAESLKRPSRFLVDGRTDSRVSHEDYTNTGYDRGHMAPNHGISQCYGADAQKETFLMSNVVPQKPDLNRKLWRKLEHIIAEKLAKKWFEVWVITGPIFDRKITRLKSGVEIPDAFYKIIIDEHRGKLRALAFILPQDVERKKPLTCFFVSIDMIEKRTGIDFLSELPDDLEDRIEKKIPSEWWRD